MSDSVVKVYLVEQNASDEAFGPIIAAFAARDDAAQFAEQNGCREVQAIELRGIDERFVRLASRALGFHLVA